MTSASRRTVILGELPVFVRWLDGVVHRSPTKRMSAASRRSDLALVRVVDIFNGSGIVDVARSLNPMFAHTVVTGVASVRRVGDGQSLRLGAGQRLGHKSLFLARSQRSGPARFGAAVRRDGLR
jgi:hypothetical protein